MQNFLTYLFFGIYIVFGLLAIFMMGMKLAGA